MVAWYGGLQGHSARLEKLKEWGRDNRNNWRQKREDILNQISNLDNIQEQRRSLLWMNYFKKLIWLWSLEK
ncbi:hypothetical protein H5410_005399 [Solanum commersonii]|uniref:Uncharacterized protein n=1 Tax=Solanum commersonii TaxID=4109 RepID=A0A9J6A6I7_SOLCO|nr:hypothetical protein H5410_005399 [Solanum commersonii]